MLNKPGSSPKIVDPIQSSKRIKGWQVLAGVLLTGLVVFGAAVLIGLPSSLASPASSISSFDFSRTLGPANAAVTIVEYGDFVSWYPSQTLEQIRAKYADKVRFVWRDFPVITADSPKANEAGFCANDQGRFWKYHDRVYEKAPDISISDLKTYAVQIGMDRIVFNQCLDSGNHQPDENQNWKNGLNHSFLATP